MKLSIHLPGAIGRRVRQAAFTIVELWVGMGVATLCLGAVGVIYVTMAKEHRTALADAVLEQRADELEDKVTQLLRTMSASQAITPGSPVSTNSSMYRLILFNAGSGLPQQRLYFDTAQSAIIYDPNIALGGDEQTLWKSETNSVVLRDFYFTLLMQPGYKPDGTLVSVAMQLDDDMASRRRSGTVYVPNTLYREFTVRLRGP
ncbi:MAG TPA: hypothetical protein DCM86_04685 [Verrucomicrobiales bacterium]|nr:hypothetical protein [Verrucomicrobiales bacterium]